MSGSVQANRLPFACVNRFEFPHELIVSGMLTDFIARPVRQSVLLTPPASIHFLVIVQAGLYRQRRDVIRNRHGAEFTDSCFRTFRLSKAGRPLPELFNFLTAAATRKNTSLGDCGARQRVKSWGEHNAADQTRMVGPPTRRELRKSDSRKRPSSP